MNSTYGYIEVLIADSREWRALGYLIDLDKNIAASKAAGKIDDPRYHIGYALHPIQDMAGHGDDYVTYSPQGNALAGVLVLGFKIWHHNNKVMYDPTKYADYVTSYIDKHGITYYHWDELIWTRNLTYDMIGRYYIEWTKDE